MEKSPMAWRTAIRPGTPKWKFLFLKASSSPPTSLLTTLYPYVTPPLTGAWVVYWPLKSSIPSKEYGAAPSWSSITQSVLAEILVLNGTQMAKNWPTHRAQGLLSWLMRIIVILNHSFAYVWFLMTSQKLSKSFWVQPTRQHSFVVGDRRFSSSFCSFKSLPTVE